MNPATITITLPLPLTGRQASLVGALLDTTDTQAAPAAAPAPAPAAAAPAATAAAPEPVKPKKATKAPKADDLLKPAAPAMTSAELHKLLGESVEKLGASTIKKIFEAHGASRFSDLKPESFGAVADAVTTALGALR